MKFSGYDSDLAGGQVPTKARKPMDFGRDLAIVRAILTMKKNYHETSNVNDIQRRKLQEKQQNKAK